MRNLVFKPFFCFANSAFHPAFLRRHISSGFSDGLNSALAAKGVIVKDRAFRNLDMAELQRRGATIVETLSEIPVHCRGNALGVESELSKPRFTKLLKQVTAHLSSISDVFVHDGALGSSTKYNANVRVITDCPSAILRLSSILWKTHNRAVSRDPCPLTVYIATTISPDVRDAVGLGDEAIDGFIAADVGWSSLILCGRAFADTDGTKQALLALSEPVIFSRGGLLLSARLLILHDSTVLLFAADDTIQSCVDALVSADAGAILSSENVTPLFRTRDPYGLNVFMLPAAVVLATSDGSGSIPSASKLSPGQAAYHFLTGYQEGKFLPAYASGPLSINPMDIAINLFSMLERHRLPSYLININQGDRIASGKDFLNLVASALSESVPPFMAKGEGIQAKYHTFMSSRYKNIPQEFSF